MKTTIAALIVIGLSTPAQAAWKYAEWGMNVDQVVTASKGSAKKPSKPDKYDNENVNHLLSAPVTVSGAKGTAKFNFSADGKLDTVKLDFPDPKSCEAIKKGYTAEFGKPEGEPAKSGSSYFIWPKTKENNRIVLSSYPAVWCFVQFSAPGYRPKESAKASSAKVVDKAMEEFHDNQKADIKAFCAAEWPTDFVMQKHCIDENNKARTVAQKFDAMQSKDHTVIWAKCSMEWKDKAGRTDWTMMSHCLQEQEAALKVIRN